MKLKLFLTRICIASFLAGCHQESSKESQLVDSTRIDSIDQVQNFVVNDSLITDSQPVEKINLKKISDLPLPIGGSVSNRLLALPKPKVEVFFISNRKDTILKGVGGTRIYIPENTFVDSRSGEKIIKPVSFSMTEYYLPSEMLAGGLTTQSGDEILETGGMVYISAASDGRKLKLGENKKLEIQFATESKQENKIFNGVEHNGKIDWQLTKNNKTNKAKEADQSLTNGISSIPKFKGDLEKYLKENIFYPPSVEKTARTGIVYAHFEVTVFGTIKNVELEGSIDPLVDKAIFYIVSNMPVWTPAGSAAKPIKSYYRLPIGFGKSRIARTMREKQRAALLEIESSEITVDYTKEGVYQYASKSFGQGNLIRKGKNKELDNAIYELDQMGWVNCDRFIKFNTPLVQFEVDKKGFENFNFFLFIKSMKGIVGPQFNDNAIVFSRVPDQSPCLLVAYEIQDKSVRFIAQDVVLSKNIFKPVAPEVLSYVAFKEELKKVNRSWQ